MQKKSSRKSKFFSFVVVASNLYRAGTRWGKPGELRHVDQADDYLVSKRGWVREGDGKYYLYRDYPIKGFARVEVEERRRGSRKVKLKSVKDTPRWVKPRGSRGHKPKS